MAHSWRHFDGSFWLSVESRRTDVGGACSLSGCGPDDTADPDGVEADTSRGTGEIRASDYDQSCETARDCTVVWVGDACPCLPCETAAIRRTAESKYQDDVREVRNRCEEEVSCEPCPRRPPARCTVDGECAVQRGDGADAGDGADTRDGSS